MTRFSLLFLAAIALAACQGRATVSEPAAESRAQADTAQAPADYHLAACYPHDPGAFTQGLIWRDGFLYESTGQYGESSLRKVRLEDGAVLQSIDLPDEIFAEGIVDRGDEIIGLTWRNGRGYRWALDDFEPRGEFAYQGEGWGLTLRGDDLLMTDGSERIVFRDPDSFAPRREITVRFNGRPVGYLNELEMVGDAIFANVWSTSYIVAIDPDTGAVERVYDLSPITAAAFGEATGPIDVLNGIAHDPATGRLFVTGKYWPLLFELRPGPGDPAAAAPCPGLPALRWSVAN